MIYKYTSSASIMAKLARDFKTGFSGELENYVMEWIGEALEAIGSNCQTMNKYVELTTENHKAELPCDLYYINQVRLCGDSVLPFSQAHFHEDDTICAKESYKIEGGYIKTRSESVDLEIDYEAFVVDDNGYPMIPDYWHFKEAVYSYIIMKCLESGLTHPVFTYDRITMKWATDRKQAKMKGELPDNPRMESFINGWQRLVQTTNFRNNFDENYNEKEKFI